MQQVHVADWCSAGNRRGAKEGAAFSTTCPTAPLPVDVMDGQGLGWRNRPGGMLTALWPLWLWCPSSPRCECCWVPGCQAPAARSGSGHGEMAAKPGTGRGTQALRSLCAESRQMGLQGAGRDASARGDGGSAGDCSLAAGKLLPATGKTLLSLESCREKTFQAGVEAKEETDALAELPSESWDASALCCS